MSLRLSLILSDRGSADVMPFVEQGNAAREALQRWAAEHGGEDVSSDASVWRTLLRAGAQAVREWSLDASYGRLAEELNEDDARGERRAARDRYVERTESKR